MWSIIAQLIILTMISAVTLTTSASAGGIVPFNLILNIRSFLSLSFFRASGAIVRDRLYIDTYQVTWYFVDVFDASWSSLPSGLNGIIGLGERSCNPTCIPPFYHSATDRESRDGAFVNKA